MSQPLAVEHSMLAEERYRRRRKVHFKASSGHIQQDFETFHKENAHVYDQLVRYARNAKRRGFQKWSIAAIIEIIRWENSVKTKRQTLLGSFDWKINNNFRSRYARLIMSQEKDLAGFFQLREIRTL